MAIQDEPTPKPYYREFWFWGVMTPLIAVMFVVAALLTAALYGADDVVVDNYYKQGRLINQSFAQDARATELELDADLAFSMDSGEVFLELSAAEGFSAPAQLLLVMDHPVSADLDQHLVLRRVGERRYRAELDRAPQYEWFLTLYPELDLDRRREADWRLRGRAEFEAEQDKSLTLNHRQPQAARQDP